MSINVVSSPLLYCNVTTFRNICEGADWLFESDDEGRALIVVPHTDPESEWGDSNDGYDDEGDLRSTA